MQKNTLMTLVASMDEKQAGEVLSRVAPLVLDRDIEQITERVEAFMSSQDLGDDLKVLESMVPVMERWGTDDLRAHLEDDQLDRLAVFALRHGALLADRARLQHKLKT